MILTTAALRERAAAMLGDGGVVVDAADVPPGHAVLPPLPAPDALAYLLYTSGSTGAPKGAVSTHRAIVSGSMNYLVQGLSMLQLAQAAGTELPAQQHHLLLGLCAGGHK